MPSNGTSPPFWPSSWPRSACNRCSELGSHGRRGSSYPSKHRINTPASESFVLGWPLRKRAFSRSATSDALRRGTGGGGAVGRGGGGGRGGGITGGITGGGESGDGEVGNGKCCCGAGGGHADGGVDDGTGLRRRGNGKSGGGKEGWTMDAAIGGVLIEAAPAGDDDGMTGMEEEEDVSEPRSTRSNTSSKQEAKRAGNRACRAGRMSRTCVASTISRGLSSLQSSAAASVNAWSNVEGSSSSRSTRGTERRAPVRVCSSKTCANSSSSSSSLMRPLSIVSCTCIRAAKKEAYRRFMWRSSQCALPKRRRKGRSCRIRYLSVTNRDLARAHRPTLLVLAPTVRRCPTVRHCTRIGKDSVHGR